ncbi:MAG TPA: tryptophan synthase subunit alpha [Acidimicrobiia bacterium]|jgi:tryptophan synthase alpha chain|nr:tryptophan synthase subunit alpha [Acidimicrobiia bacterium]
MKLEAHLRAQRGAGRKLLVPYVTGGLGTAWLDVVRAVADAGADAIEVGIPFSDPVMDGRIIQEASRRAIEIGATPAGIISDLAKVDIDVPLVVMTYYNPVQHLGHARFAASLVASGIDGAIIPDLPLDELVGSPGPDGAEPAWADAADEANVETVLLAALTTPEDRLAAICARSRGFVYGVSLLGVTGERAKLSEGALEMGRRLKAATDKPVLLGVGLSTPEHAVAAASVADGVIVGSALVRRLLEGGGPELAGALMAEFRQSLDSAVS